MQAKEKLIVTVNKTAVGEVCQQSLFSPGTIFKYYDSVDARNAISLTMKTGRGEYRSNYGLAPIFQMSLPEGGQRRRVEDALSKASPSGVMTDYDLLKLVGHNLIGRVRAHPEGLQQNVESSGLALADILGEERLMQEIFERYIGDAGVSGVHPKVLADFRAPTHFSSQTAIATKRYIIKAWGEKTQEMAFNEFQCMSAARLAGIDICDFYLSDDRKRLAVERFDYIEEEDRYLGFEDFCVLRSANAIDKYRGSIEDILAAASSVIPASSAQKAREQIFQRVIFSHATRNGDFHAKNIGVVYDSPADRESVRLAPAYDLVTTTSYVNNDLPALPMLGKKTWADRGDLIKFGVQQVLLSRRAAGVLIDKTIDAVMAQCDILENERASYRGEQSMIARCLVRDWVAGCMPLQTAGVKVKQEATYKKQSESPTSPGFNGP